MTDTPLTTEPGADDPLLARIVRGLRRHNDAVAVRPLDVARADLAARLAMHDGGSAAREVTRAGHTTARPDQPVPMRRAPVAGASWRRYARRPIAWGAYATLVLMAAWMFTMGRRTSSEDAAGSTHVYATATGQRATVTLRDGTRVTLAPRSVLRVGDFTSATRTVALEGEAYFEVARAAGAPFMVQSGRSVTRVLGTSFLVRHYASEPDVRVAVTSGRVAVSTMSMRRTMRTLSAGLVADITDSGVTTAMPGDMAPYTGWLDGQLVFYNAPAPDVLATLTRWYGYEFRFADPALARQHVTVAVSTRSSAEALASLRLVLHVDLAFDGNVVTLTPGGEGHEVRARSRRDVDRDVNTREREVGR